MEDEIDLRDIFHVLWKRRLLIISCFVIAVLLGGIISYALPPVYETSSIISIGNFDDPVYTSPSSITEIMLSDEFLLGVFQEIKPNAAAREFRSFTDNIKVIPIGDKLIKISIENKKKQEGLDAVDTMIKHYSMLSENSYQKQKKILSDQITDNERRIDTINKDINQTRDIFENLQDTSDLSLGQAELRISRTIDLLAEKETERSALMDLRIDLQKQSLLISDLDVVQPAREPISPVWPKKALIVVVAGMLGICIGILAAFFKEGLKGEADN